MASIFAGGGVSRNKPDPRFDEIAARRRIADLRWLIDQAARLGHPWTEDDQDYYATRSPYDEIREIAAKLQYGPFREFSPLPAGLDRKIRETVLQTMFQSAPILGALKKSSAAFGPGFGPGSLYNTDRICRDHGGLCATHNNEATWIIPGAICKSSNGHFVR